MAAELKYLVDTKKTLESLNEEEQAIASLIDTLKEMALVDRRDVPTIAELDLRLQNLYPKRQNIQDQIADLEKKLRDIDNLTDKKAKLSDAGESIRVDEALEEIDKLRKQYLAEIIPLNIQKQELENKISNLTYDIEAYSKPGNELLHNLVDHKINDREVKKAELEELEVKIREYNELLANLDVKEKPLLEQKQALTTKMAKEDSYVDKIKEHQLNDELNQLNNSLNEVNVEIGKILNNPIYLAAVAYEQLKNHSLEPLKNIIDQLVSLANDIPYMNTLTADVSSLDEIEKESIAERNRSYRERKNTSVITKALKERLASIPFDQADLETNLLETRQNLGKKLETISLALEKVDAESRRLEVEIANREEGYHPDNEQDKLKNEEEVRILKEELKAANQLFTSYMDEFKSLKAELKAISDVLGIMSNLKLINNDDLKADLEAKVASFEGLNIPSLVRKSEIDRKVEELTNKVIGIKHRKKFASAPVEVQNELNTMLASLQSRREKEIRAGLELDEPKEVVEEEPAVAEVIPDEVPVVDLNSEEETPDYGMESSVNNPFSEPVAAPLDDTMEVPGFNPLDVTASQPVVEDSLGKDDEEPVRVISMEPVGARENGKDHQASFEDIIPQEPKETSELDFADLDQFLNGDFLQSTLASDGIKR